MLIKIKRVYDEPDESDGYRILIDRLWPRGLSKEKAKIDLWLKDIAPSDNLRKRFAHDPNKWVEFKKRYFEEIDNNKKVLELMLKKAKEGAVTLLYGAKNEKFNNAVVLKEYIEKL
jgi:uncharacterized protein YeaO (DUF488 family)